MAKHITRKDRRKRVFGAGQNDRYNKWKFRKRVRKAVKQNPELSFDGNLHKKLNEHYDINDFK